MKRTEKIEVRVSLEEKQTLTQLAKQDGESVSGLIRGLVEKYMALNSASTVRKLPKWQIAAGLIVAAFIGHGLTLIPLHLHERGHQSARASTPVYMVHGAIDNSAFGVGIQEDDATKEFTLNRESDNPVRIKLAFKPNSDAGGILRVQCAKWILMRRVKQHLNPKWTLTASRRPYWAIQQNQANPSISLFRRWREKI